MIRAFWFKAKAYITAVMIGSIALLGAIVLGQFFWIANQSEKIKEISTENQALRSAISLTQKLQEDNAEIYREMTEVLRELESAKGASDPLSDDIRRIVDSMQSGAISAPGAAE